MTQSTLSPESPLIKAAKHASDLIDLYLSATPTSEIIKIREAENKKLKCSSEEGSVDSDASFTSDCTMFPVIDPEEYEILDEERQNCKEQVKISMKVLEEALERYS